MIPNRVPDMTPFDWSGASTNSNSGSKIVSAVKEGLYVDLGHTTGNMLATPTKTTRFNNTAAIGRVKLNYKF
jgi:hypothetical protein